MKDNKYFVSWFHNCSDTSKSGFGCAVISLTINHTENIGKFMISIEKWVANYVQKEEETHVTDVVILNFIEVNK